MMINAMEPGHPGACLFQAIVEKDHDALVKLYATNARNSVGSYLSMKSRWAQQQEHYSKSGTFKKLLVCEIIGLVPNP